ncbi:MAG: extracellular solute-binding protein [Spirochaetes bacterium]|jgi:alpha-glucoside transport system substrate-binding protein|nr:extracellular solute-binding protein [Spirochaetota bacterium]
MRAAIILLIAVPVLLAGCAGSQVSEGTSTEEVARNLAQQVVSGIPDEASVLILGFYESGNGSLHAANDALTADLTIEFLNAPDRDIRIINRDMLNQALGELKFSLSELSDSEKAQRIGGFLSADVLVKGTVSSDFVSVECTDVETLTLLAVGKYTATQRMVFGADDGAAAGGSGGGAAFAGDGAAGDVTASRADGARGETESGTRPTSNPWTDGADLSGRSVRILGALVDADAESFDMSMVPFIEQTGIDVLYDAPGDLHMEVLNRIEEGAPPDVVLIPQPSFLYEMVERGHVQNLEEWFGRGYFEEHYDESWLASAEYDGIMAGAWYRAAVKSLVWYPYPEFQEAGYEVPRTWEELIALSEAMVADGNTPWSIALESGYATGWVATDWMEDIMLRTVEPETYDRWVEGDLPFDSSEVRRAADIMGEIWFNDDYVLGGTDGILRTPFGDGALPLVENPPEAWLHRQGQFISNFVPPDVEAFEHMRYFYLPPIDEAHGSPVLIGGDIAAAVTDTPQTRAIMRYLTQGISTRGWVESGSMVSPHRSTDLDWYPDEFSRGYAMMLADADTIRFDASDMMPPEVGAGSFWRGMTEWTEGRDAAAVFRDIDETWPR